MIDLKKQPGLADLIERSYAMHMSLKNVVERLSKYVGCVCNGETCVNCEIRQIITELKDKHEWL